MRKRRKNNKIIILLLVLLAIGIGFAAISTALKLNGNIGFNKHAWDVRWENIANRRGAVPITAPTISNDTDGTDDVEDAVVSFSVQLNNFGDYYEFTVDAANYGDINAKIASIDLFYDNALVSSANPLPKYARFTITNPDGSDIEIGEVLGKADSSTDPVTPTKRTFKVKVSFVDDGMTQEDLNNMNEYESHTFGFNINYVLTRDAASVITRTISLGDYFTMVPDSDSYTIPASDTGWSEDQTINPQNTTLWRVVKINQDGTYEAVSEYVTVDKIILYGLTGYMNYVDVLQNASSQYTKAGYTVSARAFGYDGQTLSLTDSSDIYDVISSYDYDLDTPTLNVGTGREYDGGVRGDTLYLKDTQLVSPFYRTYNNYGLDTSGDSYYVASRSLKQSTGGCSFCGRVVAGDIMYDFGMYTCDDESYEIEHSGLRPIITLNANIVAIDGTGNISDPYILQ